MKKIILLLVITLLWVEPAFALIRTRNVDIDEGGFQYKVAYQFATTDVGAVLDAAELCTDATITNQLYYTMPFKGSIVGISIASNAALTNGSMTADVTINGIVTGVRTAIDGQGAAKDVRAGEVTAHTTYNYNTILFDDDSPPDWGGGYHDTKRVYGKATPLSAGDRIGVKLSTTGDLETTASTILAPTTNEVNVTVMILQ